LKLWVSNAFREIFQVHIHISSARNEQLLVPLSCHQKRIMTTADRVLGGKSDRAYIQAAEYVLIRFGESPTLRGVCSKPSEGSSDRWENETVMAAAHL
jgi:hypothetical protein